jgi:hypothetical protein
MGESESGSESESESESETETDPSRTCYQSSTRGYEYLQDGSYGSAWWLFGLDPGPGGEGRGGRDLLREVRGESRRWHGHLGKGTTTWMIVRASVQVLVGTGAERQ